MLADLLTVPCVLATTFCDVMVKQDAADLVLSNPNVRAWYATQVMARHPKLHAMPLGIEAHKNVDVTKKRDVRDIRILVNFGVNRRGRIDAFHYWSKRPDATVLPCPSPQDVYLDAVGRSQFVVSPPGHGWDCYRTYEVIAMGAMPIVLRREPASDVLQGLPVVLVDRWEDATAEVLDQAWANRSLGPWPTLTLSYWAERLRRDAIAA